MYRTYLKVVDYETNSSTTHYKVINLGTNKNPQNINLGTNYTP